MTSYKPIPKNNENNTQEQQIKPLNFYNLGFQTTEENGKSVKPLAPLSSNPQEIVYEPFIDYETGEIKQGSHYFKPLSKIIMQYVNHPESKFDGDIGILEIKHVHADGVIYIGKEANNIDEQALDVKKAQEFVNKEEIMQLILDLSQKQAEEWEVDRKTFQTIKKSMRESLRKGEKINLFTPARKRLLEYLYL